MSNSLDLYFFILGISCHPPIPSAPAGLLCPAITPLVHSCAYCLTLLCATVFISRIVSHPRIDAKLPVPFLYLMRYLLPSSESLCSSWSSLHNYHSFDASCADCLTLLGVTVLYFRIVSHPRIVVKLPGPFLYFIRNLQRPSDSLGAS